MKMKTHEPLSGLVIAGGHYIIHISMMLA